MKIKNYTLKIFHRRGFTLIEILITFGIIAILGTTIGFSLFGVRQGQDLDGAAKRIAGILQEAQQRSITQEGGFQYGVRFTKPAVGAHTFELFQQIAAGEFSGGYYAIGSPSVPTTFISLKPYVLKSSLEFMNPDTAQDWIEDIVFKKIEGAAYPKANSVATPPVYNAITVRIVGSVCSSNDCRTIKVNDNGTIEIQ